MKEFDLNFKDRSVCQVEDELKQGDVLRFIRVSTSAVCGHLSTPLASSQPKGGVVVWEEKGRSRVRVDGKASPLPHDTDPPLPSDATRCQQWVGHCCSGPMGSEIRRNWHFASPFQLCRLDPASDIYGILLGKKENICCLLY